MRNAPYAPCLLAVSKRAVGPFCFALLTLAGCQIVHSQMLGRLTELESEVREQNRAGDPLLNGMEANPESPSWAQREELREFQDDPEFARQRQALHDGCDLGSGKWVFDPSYPLWAPGSCSLGWTSLWNCMAYGRNNSDFMRFRWQPDSCTLPRFNATRAREALRGKRIVFMGDSLNRNQWHSLNCMLSSGLPDRNEGGVEGRKEHSRDPFTSTRENCLTRVTYHRQFNFTVEFRFSTNLVMTTLLKDDPNIDKSKVKPEALDTGLMDLVTSNFVNDSMRWGLPTDSNTILLLNTGWWWFPRLVLLPHTGDAERKPMPMDQGFEAGMRTVATWLQNLRQETGAHVIWKSLPPEHFTGGEWNTGGICPATLPQPGRTSPPAMGVTGFGPVSSRVMREAGIDVLDISALSDKRPDGHPQYNTGWNSTKGTDCMHWCLPGVPDTWNELLFALLTMRRLL